MAYLTTNRIPRTLILCFDGTSDAFDDDATNVVRLFSALEKERPDRQLCYYQPGIGTYLGPNRPWSSTLQRVVKVVDQAFAWYLDDHVMGGYRFLMENYVKGDTICMFGFSRGAYTARCLAGMLNKVGLLPRSNEEHISFAYEKYSDTSPGNDKRAQGFKDAFSMTVEVAFVGVWDTVASCGLVGRNLPFTASNRIIRVFRHALALDERRSRFKPNPWHRKAPSREAAKNDPNHASFDDEDHRMQTQSHPSSKRGHKKPKKTVLSVNTVACDFEETQCDVREVWFPGCHADVGGGSVRNDEEHSLANPSLVWMVNHIIDTNVGILFKLSAFEGEAFRGIKPVVQSGTQRSDMIDLVNRDETASPTSLGEAAILLQTAEGSISEINITSSEPGIKRRVPPAKKPTVMFDQDAPEHSKPPLSASSRKTVFSFSLTVSGVEQQTALPARPPSPSSPMTTSSSPISPISWTLRNEFILGVDEKTIPISLASKDRKSGKPNSEPESPRLLRLEQVNEDNDANAVMVDQLHKEKFWWLLEFIPFWQHYQDRGAYWYKGFRMNRGRPRDISDPEPLFHSSVAKRKDYTPKARVHGSKPDYVGH